MRKYSARQAAEMSEKEIEWAPFKGAGPYELRGLSDAFSMPAIRVIAERKDLGWELRARAIDIIEGV